MTKDERMSADEAKEAALAEAKHAHRKLFDNMAEVVRFEDGVRYGWDAGRKYEQEQETCGAVICGLICVGPRGHTTGHTLTDTPDIFSTTPLPARRGATSVAMPDHETIYLLPECSAYEGRLWCEDDANECDEHKSTKYVRSDLYEHVYTRMVAAETRVAELEA